jgi:hypothetical protein
MATIQDTALAALVEVLAAEVLTLVQAQNGDSVAIKAAADRITALCKQLNPGTP